MGRKGNLAVFESTNISETKETTSTKIGVHAFDINLLLLFVTYFCFVIAHF